MDWKTWGAGIAITVFAAAVRMVDLNWDSTALLASIPSEGFHGPATTHPDERAIFSAVERLNVENWNPQFFAYGSLPMYLIKFASLFAQLFAGPAWGDNAHIALAGRFLGALFGTGTVLATFVLGWRMFGAATGILGSVFLALSVQHVQLSHFATTDVHVGLFAALCLWGAWEIVHHGGAMPALLTGVAAGLGTASKFNGVTLVGVVLAAHVLRGIEIRRLAHNAESHGERDLALAEAPGEWGLHLTVSLAAGLVAFSIAQPYAWLDFQSCWGAIFGERDMVTGRDMRPYVQQYIGTARYLYPLEQLVRWGMGPALGVSAVAATLAASFLGIRSLLRMMRRVGRPLPAFARRVRRKEARAAASLRGKSARANAFSRAAPSPASTWPAPEGFASYATILLLAWIIPNFLVVGAFQVKFPRYLIALYPAACLLAALLFTRAWNMAPVARAIARSAAGAVVVATAFWMFAFLRIYFAPHTYVQATAWAIKELPQGSTVVTETWNEEVPMYGGMGHLRMGDDLKLPIYDMPDSAEKAHRMCRMLASGDYTCLASSTLWATLIKLGKPDGRYPNNVYPLTSAMYRLLFSGGLGYQRDRVFTKYPRLFGIEFNDDAVDVTDAGYHYRCDQSFSFYDHPKVMFFKNTDRLTEDQMVEKLEEDARSRGLAVPGRI